MKKIKRLLTIALTALFAFGAFCVSACQSMEDIIPETYGEWEQNYLYRGNGRTKTTGEDYEQLVKTVEIDGKTYKAWHCVDSEVHEDDLYMILACMEEGAHVSDVRYSKYSWAYDLDTVYCLVVYNLKEKTQKLLATDEKVMREDMEYFYRPTDIEGIFGDRILLRAYTEPMVGRESTIGYYRDLEVEWYTVDLDGALLDTSVAYDNEWEWVSDEYLVAEIYNEENGSYDLYYRTSDLSEPIFIQRRIPGQRDIEWNYVEQNGVKGLLLREYYYKKWQNHNYALGEMRFYNFETKTMSEPTSIYKYAEFYGNYSYVKTCLYKMIEYYAKWNEKDSRSVETDNALYRLVYDENGVHLEEILDLTEEHTYTIYGVRGDKVLYYEYWYQDHRGCMYGGNQSSYCEWDLTAKKGTATDEDTIKVMEDECSATYEQEKGVAIGDYIYFLHEESIFGGLMGNSTVAYMLKRRNVQTNELEVMQVWHERDNDGEDGRKFCEEFWFVCKNDASEFNFYDFTVRAY